MPENEYDLENNASQNINDGLSMGHLLNNDLGGDTDLNNLVPLEQNANNSNQMMENQVENDKNQDINYQVEVNQEQVNEKRNDPDFQKNLQNILPKNEDVIQPKMKEPQNLNALVQQWQKEIPPFSSGDGTGGSPLPEKLKVAIEQLSGYSMDDVKVFYNSIKPGQIGAHAFAQGTNIHVGPGQEEHLPHEAWHVAQQKQGKIDPTLELNGLNINDSPSLEKDADLMGDLAANETTNQTENSSSDPLKEGSTTDTIQGKFEPANISKNAHLRADGAWKTHIGSKINKNTVILADDATKNDKEETGCITSTTWKGAVNVDPETKEKPTGDQSGYLRSNKVNFTGDTLDDVFKTRIEEILLEAEGKHGSLSGHLNKPENVQFLLDKAIRYGLWNQSASLDTFVSGFTTKEEKIARIKEGAEYVADSLEHWREWLHNEKSDEVTIENVKFVQSDLHERGLGVLSVKFKKPLGGGDGNPFADQTDVDVMVKPEDKSLEKNLLGSDEGSAVSQINEIAGLTDESEMLAGIKMACDDQHGSLVEKVQGMSAEDLTKANGDKPVTKAFHETLVFAFLAGIDDLHRENVFWNAGKPYLVDADNVLSHNQMINKDNGEYTQSGFGSNYDASAAKENKAAIKTKDNRVDSKLLDVMINNKGKAIEIMQVLKGAIAGKKGRVVPISTRSWGQKLNFYTTNDDTTKTEMLTSISKEDAIVREGKSFEAGTGPGLFGTSSKNTENTYYDEDGEKAEIRKDFDSGVIPFYEYDYNTGFVTHNGSKIYHGQTLTQGLKTMIESFGHELDGELD